jgi:Multiubiquitin
MNDTPPIDTEALGAAREAPPHAPRPYQVAVSDDAIHFRTIDIPDPVPLGRQLLSAAGHEPPDEFSLFAILPSGDFEDVRLDETFDLRGKGAERFVAFRSDRIYRLTLNGHELRWGQPAISGAALYALAKVTGDEAVFLDVRGGRDRLIEAGDTVDLTDVGVERFFTAPRPPRTFEIIVNARPRTVTGSTVTFEQVVQMAFPGQHDPNTVFDVTFHKAASTPPAGQLGPGGTTTIKNGTVFNVTRTVQS